MSAASAKLPMRPRAQPLRALVVDDSQPALKALCAYVERDRQFVVVKTARDGREALQRARSCLPDLLVIDFEIPDLNGIDVARTLLTEFPALPIVVVSMYDTSELRHLCDEIGARAFVTKQRLSQELPAVLKKIHRALTSSL